MPPGGRTAFCMPRPASSTSDDAADKPSHAAPHPGHSRPAHAAHPAHAPHSNGRPRADTPPPSLPSPSPPAPSSPRPIEPLHRAADARGARLPRLAGLTLPPLHAPFRADRPASAPAPAPYPPYGRPRSHAPAVGATSDDRTAEAHHSPASSRAAAYPPYPADLPPPPAPGYFDASGPGAGAGPGPFRPRYDRRDGERGERGEPGVSGTAGTGAGATGGTGAGGTGGRQPAGDATAQAYAPGEYHVQEYATQDGAHSGISQRERHAPQHAHGRAAGAPIPAFEHVAQVAGGGSPGRMGRSAYPAHLDAPHGGHHRNAGLRDHELGVGYDAGHGGVNQKHMYPRSLAPSHHAHGTGYVSHGYRGQHGHAQPPQPIRLSEKRKADIAPPPGSSIAAYSNMLTPFIYKLYCLVSDDSTADLCHWSPAGDSFIVPDPTPFAATVLPRFFKHNQFASFVRQLNKYRFHKLTPGTCMFGHEKFLRDRPELLPEIVRQRSPDRPSSSVGVPASQPLPFIAGPSSYGHIIPNSHAGSPHASLYNSVGIHQGPHRRASTPQEGSLVHSQPGRQVSLSMHHSVGQQSHQELASNTPDMPQHGPGASGFATRAGSMPSLRGAQCGVGLKRPREEDSSWVEGRGAPEFASRQMARVSGSHGVADLNNGPDVASLRSHIDSLKAEINRERGAFKSRLDNLEQTVAKISQTLEELERRTR